MTQKVEIFTKNVNGVWYGVACDEREVFATTFTRSEKQARESLLASVPPDMEIQATSTPSAFAENAISSVKNVYEGKGEIGNIPLATSLLTPFMKNVLEVTRLIPVGYVTSYGALSEAAGGSPRAVGGAMAANPFAPIVPCHRVVKSDLTLGGYGGGLDLKTEILKREKRGNTLSKEIPIGGKKLRIFPVEFSLEKVQRENETKKP